MRVPVVGLMVVVVVVEIKAGAREQVEDDEGTRES